MKILAIGKNYVNDKVDLADITKGFQMIFSKPSSSMVTDNKDVVYPSFTSKLLYEAELVIKIGKSGKNITEADAPSYISEIGIGIDYTAKDILNKTREKKGPWELAKGFDGAAPVSSFLPVANFKDLNDINFSLTINGEQKQVDLIFTGTPAKGAGESFKGDHLQAFIEGQLLLDFKVI